MTKKKTTERVGLWQAIRDVLIASMNKGQFPLAICALVFIVMVLRMPPEDVSKLMFEIIKKLENGQLIGYLVAGATGLGWRIHVKWQRRMITSEMERLSNERNRLQETTIGAQLASSEPHKKAAKVRRT